MQARFRSFALVVTVAMATLAALAATALPALAADPGVTPATVTLDLDPGETSSPISKTIQTPAVAPKLDVYFLADTTGSMGSALTNVRDNAAGIISDLEATGSDIAYGAGDYKDFPYSYAFNHVADITADGGTAAQGAIAAWSPSGGADGAEGQFYALHELATDPSVGWRTGASRVVVWFGDAPGHDPVCAAISGAATDITEASVTTALEDAGITVLAVSTPTGVTGALDADPTGYSGDYAGTCTIGGSAGQASRITDATGGQHLVAATSGEVSDLISSGLASLEMTITPVATCDDGLSAGFTPASTTVAAGDAATFDETITAAADASGTLTCTVDWQINGAAGAPAFQQTVTVTVADAGGSAECVDLIAGQSMDVGEVCVSDDGDTMTVEYTTDDGWQLVETHLHVAGEEADIPQNRKGNPKIGHFEHSDPHAWTDAYSYTFPLPDSGGDDEWAIAAHAVVEKVDTSVELDAAGRWATGYSAFDQGDRTDGSDVLAERSDPANALVADSETATNFASLGFGGSIVIEFDCAVPNLDGDDLRLWEVTNATYPAETARVEVLDPHTGTWVEIGTADNSGQASGSRLTESAFDLGSVMYTHQVRITDTSDASLHDATADGFDLDGVESLQACHPILRETAWGDGAPFIEDGRGSWAMYVMYPTATSD